VRAARLEELARAVDVVGDALLALDLALGRGEHKVDHVTEHARRLERRGGEARVQLLLVDHAVERAVGRVQAHLTATATAR
jgi:hypothetical protein